ncbi:MAG: hypothetical protein NXI08_11785 [bacterium]|jgi:hypothetical protein|nr:hypothetical protein [bacterium]
MSTSALIFTDNFITNATLSDILSKVGVDVISVTSDWNKAKDVLVKYSPSHVFIDYQSLKNSEEALKISRFFHSISDSELTFMMPQNHEEVKQKHLLNVFSANLLPTPFNSQDVRNVISKEAIHYFYGVDY